VFFLSKTSRRTPRPTQPPVQWVAGFLSGGKAAGGGSEVDPTPPSTAEVKSNWSYTSAPPV
jgi:hypothetical protein